MSKQTKWWSFRNAGELEAELEIYDEISWWGTMAADFMAELKEVTAPVINLRINSPGGFVTEGMAIFNRLKEHKSKVITHIDGLAASMASVIALAGDDVRIAESALYMIHNPNGGAVGESGDMRKVADLLDKMRGQIVDIYHDKTGIDKEEIIDMMDAETWMTGGEAVLLGFADSTYEGVRAAANVATAIGKISNKANFKRLPVVVAQPGETPTNQKHTNDMEKQNKDEVPENKAEAKFSQADVDAAVEAAKVEAVQAAKKIEDERVAAITAIADKHGLAAEAVAAINGKVGVSEFQASVNDSLQARIDDLEAAASKKNDRDPVKDGDPGKGGKSDVDELLDKLNNCSDPRERNVLTKSLRAIQRGN